MNPVTSSENLDARVRELGPYNGLSLVFVSLESSGTPDYAWLDVEFHNGKHLQPLPAPTKFQIVGGERVPGGSGPNEIKVTGVQKGGPRTLRLRVAPIGDYSTYTLRANWKGIDPRMQEIGFKFRPGCFNLNCAPAWEKGRPRPEEPLIDYLARDYDSLRHVLVTSMAERVPGWAPTSEADLDQVLIDLLAAEGDELADYQDRVGNEAYLATARGRVSLARHARLMDYHVHQGNQASTTLAVTVREDVELPENTNVWCGESWKAPDSVIFALPAPARCFADLNEFDLYTWSDTVMSLDVGVCEADLTLPGMTKEVATSVRDSLLAADAWEILIQEELNPATGMPNGRDPRARQVLRLVANGGKLARAEVVEDPVFSPSRWMVRVRWQEDDRLRRPFCFASTCGGDRVDGVTRFYGNLVTVTQGRPWTTTFADADKSLPVLDADAIEGSDGAVYEPTQEVELPAKADAPISQPTILNRWGVLCPLTQGPLAYRGTANGGDDPAQSTVGVTVDDEPWKEQIDFISSQPEDKHFLVETDEYARSHVRFGNGVNGQALPRGSVVRVAYRVGQGVGGNVGCDTLTSFEQTRHPELIQVWNPFDVSDGRAPEPAAEIQRRAPEAYRKGQLRAVTLEDYGRRAEDLPTVSHARATYVWTGSWRSVRVAIDPAGTDTLESETARDIEAHLDAVRLIGEDLEIRPAEYVPLDIVLRVCAHPDYWPDDLLDVLEAEFSSGLVPDGRLGFFHPDRWTFGQPLYASQVVGRALSVTGVDRVLYLSMRRFNPGSGGGLDTVTLAASQLPESVVEKLEVKPSEIIRVENDPSRLEAGRITFEILGGRR